MFKKAICLLILLLLIPALLLAQQVSEKKEIAVFKLGYYKWSIPNEVLGNIDEEIKGVFINIGRFDVMGMNQRLEEGDLNDFIARLKELKQTQVEIPAEVQMGREFFTEADLNRLIGSFVVVIPSVSNYILEELDSGDYEATIKTSFTFFNVEEERTFAQFSIETSGQEESSRKAVSEAVNAIPLQLTYEIRKVPEFQLKTGVLEVRGTEVFLEFGRDMGIKLGDEYVLMSASILKSGKSFSSEQGLLIVKEVSDEVSKAQIIYAKDGPRVGDQLQEVPRLGFDTSPYLRLALGAGEDGKSLPVVGFRQSVLRGFYDFRPLVGIEVPFIRNILWGVPLNFYVGAEYDIYLGRLQIVPMAGFGMGGAYLWYLENGDEEDDEFVLSHLGGMANVTVTYLATRDIKLTAEAGYMYWFSLDPTSLFFDESLLFKSYGGLFVGAGLSFKY
jgi:hypothetical protein